MTNNSPKYPLHVHDHFSQISRATYDYTCAKLARAEADLYELEGRCAELAKENETLKNMNASLQERIAKYYR